VRSTGNAALEFALTFLVLWTLMAGAFRIGYSIYVYQALVTAVAGAGRYAARVDFDSPNHTFVANVQRMAVYGAPGGGNHAIAPQLAPANVSVTWNVDAKGVPLTITVSIVNYSLDALFQTFRWSGKPTVTVRFAGRYVT
jgi:Flp pilus assembly protein TadG